MQSGVVQVAFDVEVLDKPILRLPSGELTVTEARVSGTVEWVDSVLPLEAMSYLAGTDGASFAGTVLVGLRSGLLGLATSPS